MGAPRLRIAMLAPVSWPVPPVGYGPWEQVVSNLTEELVRAGHEVTLFAAPGSHTTAKLVETVPHALALWPEDELRAPRRLDPHTGLLEGPPDFRALEEMHVATAMEAVAAGGFDVVHSHLHVHALTFARLLDCPLVTTLHGVGWVRALHPLLARYREQAFVSISDSERRFLPELNYVATVYNGVRLEEFPLCEEKDDYLLFAGRLAPEKGAAEAVAIARRAGRPLRLAGLIERQHQAYFDAEVRPHLDARNVEYLGLLSQRELTPWYQRAAAVLFPLRWAEPCGMVAIEAQACGTPLVARPCGSMPEIVRHGRTGFLAETIDEAAAAVGQLARLDPRACRANAEERFSAAAMAAGYQRVYRRVLAGE